MHADEEEPDEVVEETPDDAVDEAPDDVALDDPADEELAVEPLEDALLLEEEARLDRVVVDAEPVLACRVEPVLVAVDDSWTPPSEVASVDVGPHSGRVASAAAAANHAKL